MQKQREANAHEPKQQQQDNKDSSNGYQDGFFGPGLLNPFKSSHNTDLNEDFLMTDFENLLRSKPQDVHKRMKLSSDSSQPIAHLNL